MIEKNERGVKAGKEWCGKRKIGLTRRRFPTEGWMIRVSHFLTALTTLAPSSPILGNCAGVRKAKNS